MRTYLRISTVNNKEPLLLSDYVQPNLDFLQLSPICDVTLLKFFTLWLIGAHLALEEVGSASGNVENERVRSNNRISGASHSQVLLSSFVTALLI